LLNLADLELISEDLAEILAKFGVLAIPNFPSLTKLNGFLGFQASKLPDFV
jgi:hypothetical protein